MQSAQDRVRDAVLAIQTWLPEMPNPGEAVVRQAVVLRLLHAAGFDIWNPAEVVPEETNATGNRADFLIRVGAGKFALELKGMGVILSATHYQQVATYAANEGTRWAMLTTGRVWVVLDRTHNPGGTFQEHEVLKLELGQEGQTFADDLAALLDVQMWREDRFEGVVEALRQRQQQRLDEARIRLEKTPVVEAVMQQFQIPTFETAALAAAEMNRITQAERDVLLGRAPSPLPEISARKVRRERRKRKVENAEPPSSSGETEISFTYRIGAAVAQAVYRPAEGTWTVQPGSTALREVKPYAKTAARHREDLQAAGRLVVRSPDLLEYTAGVVYSSPSAAADDISGASKNGWNVWVDRLGRTAQFHRPGRKLRD